MSRRKPTPEELAAIKALYHHALLFDAGSLTDEILAIVHQFLKRNDDAE